ncbi:MAG TPA: heme exporter protein CcmD [Casimicrobiaceae bacterium]|jgi:heme exporter protein CcmD|nr:heme exporter protein CcmD [Casimicrobiaceae bacterium]HET9747959.1 heme exporter protein CcmD [Casimicrobiaceae bacterium]HWD17045.1 heme exporter protein CcmD [Casimicrobiaceae bacterium]HWD36186.1 heme exporter protein CcmD [Casimicrobiaceae bacterium]
MLEFLAMGGYAWYVWMAYGVAALAIVVEIVAVRARRQRAFDALRMAAQSARPPASTLRPRSAP